jgi:GxxExxY protein
VDAFQFRERGNSGVNETTELLAERVIGAAIEVHKHLGPGLPEIAYRNALAKELELRGIEYQLEVPTQIVYKGATVAEGRIDLLVGRSLIVELKVVEAIGEVHIAQTIAYLKTTKLQLGLIINFNVALLRNGIKRVVNTTNSLCSS